MHICWKPTNISIHPPLVGWDPKGRKGFHHLVISIHPPLVGWDPEILSQPLHGLYFNPPTPCGVGPVFLSKTIFSTRFQSTHPLWGGTPCVTPALSVLHISIHPPLVGWDLRRWPPCGWSRYFNPPTPCGVGRCQPRPGSRPDQFQSTHPLWGGTCGIIIQKRGRRFQSTHSLWGGTKADYISGNDSLISIHPPLVGWDSIIPDKPPGRRYFNPPTPCGVGLQKYLGFPTSPAFQSTHPLWGGTLTPRVPRLLLKFQSTHPLWGGTIIESSSACGSHISIHPPLVGWDNKRTIIIRNINDFNPPAPCGVGLGRRYVRYFLPCYFNPPTPCGVGRLRAV